MYHGLAIGIKLRIIGNVRGFLRATLARIGTTQLFLGLLLTRMRVRNNLKTIISIHKTRGVSTTIKRKDTNNEE